MTIPLPESRPCIQRRPPFPDPADRAGLPAGVGAGALLYALQQRGVAPRALAPYLERRAAATVR